jgi:hypothetical protein
VDDQERELPVEALDGNAGLAPVMVDGADSAFEPRHVESLQGHTEKVHRGQARMVIKDRPESSVALFSNAGT